MPGRKRVPDIVLADAIIFARNFAGKATRFDDGKRAFCLAVPLEMADGLKEAGWNVKFPEVEEGEDPRPYLRVKVNIAGDYPPEVFRINSRGMRRLHGSEIDMLDDVGIAKCSLVISPYVWTEGKITAYLRKIVLTVKEDAIDELYRDVPLYDDDRA